MRSRERPLGTSRRRPGSDERSLRPDQDRPVFERHRLACDRWLHDPRTLWAFEEVTSMKINKCSPFVAALTAVIVAITVPALAQDSFIAPYTLEKRAMKETCARARTRQDSFIAPFTLEKRAAAQHVDR